MATQTVNEIIAGYIPYALTTSPGFTTTTFVIDADDEKVACIFRAPKSGNIRKLLFRLGTTTTGENNVAVRLETVDASGNPSGTLKGTNTSGTVNILDTDDATMITCQLTADAAVTRGDQLAAVISRAVCAGTLVTQISGFADETFDFPYSASYTPSSWSKSNIPLIFACEYDDGTYAPITPLFPFSAFTSTNLNSGTNPNRRALRFKFPVPVRLTGIRVWCDLDQPVSFILYDSDGATVLETITADVNRASACPNAYYFPSVRTLAKDTFYRIAVLCSAASPNISWYEFSVPSAAAMDAVPPGQNFHLSTCNGAPANEAAWTQVTTSRPFMQLIIDGLDDGAGGTVPTPMVAGVS